MKNGIQKALNATKQYIIRNWLVLVMCFVLILIFVFGGMYFRHVIYNGSEQVNEESNRIELNGNLSYQNLNETIVKYTSSDTNRDIIVNVTFHDVWNGGHQL